MSQVTGSGGNKQKLIKEDKENISYCNIPEKL